jgi:hypothetical protein
MRRFLRLGIKKKLADGLTPFFIGRDERIRTSDPFTPSEVRYQTALRPDRYDGL